MLLRLLLLLLLCSGLAAGPVCGAAACAETECGHCCADPSADCCAKGNAPVDEAPPAAIRAVDVKQAVVPDLVCLGGLPKFVVPSASTQQRTPARLPVQPRLDVTCIRLV